MRHPLARCLLGLLLLAVTYAPTHGQPATQPAPLADLEYGPETTVFTGPRREDGSIDYVAAVNQHLGEGIEPADNAAVVIADLMPPDAWGKPWVRVEYFRGLGVEAPPDDAIFFIEWKDYANGRGIEAADAEAMFEQASAGPWRAGDLPEVAWWLDEMADPLARLEEGVRRPRYFSPLVGDDQEESLAFSYLPTLGFSRRLSNAFEVRVMRRLAEGDPVGAWRDILTIKRLSRHMSHEFTLIGQLVAYTIDAATVKCFEQLCSSHDIDRERLDAMLADLDALPPMQPAATALERSELLNAIDHVINFRRGHIDFLPYPESIPLTHRAAVSSLQHPYFDINAALRHLHRRFEQLGRAMREPDHQVARGALHGGGWSGTFEEITEQFQAMAKTGTLPEAERSAAYSAAAADLIVLLLSEDQHPGMFRQSELRIHAADRLERVAVALAAYRTERGISPADL